MIRRTALALGIVTSGCAATPPRVVPEDLADLEPTVILSEPPGATIVVDAETLPSRTPLLIRHRRDRADGAGSRVRIRALATRPDQCPQRFTIAANEPAPDTIRFQMARCPTSDADFARVFDADELNERPERLRGPMPDASYLLHSGHGGCVLLRFEIDTTGTPVNGSVQLLAATDTGFIPSAALTILGSKFKPGRIQGRKVRTRVVVPVTYAIHGEADWGCQATWAF